MVWALESRAPEHAPALRLDDIAGATRHELLRALSGGPKGLTEAQAVERLVVYGENTLPERRPPGWPSRLARAASDPFTLVLFGLGAVSAMISSWGTACVIVVLVAVSCLLRATGEHRADRAAAALRALIPATATVVRRPSPEEPPRAREVPIEELVPGDAVKLGPGDLVPADVRLLRSSGFTVLQAALTGESAPTALHAVDRPAPGQRDHLCRQGGSVASGSALAVVVATGERTRLADARLGAGSGRARPAFDRAVDGISWLLVRFMLLVPPVALVADAIVQGRGLEAVPFIVAVAVGLTPEMLPVVVTAVLARGSAVLARDRGVIVKSLPALHDLGAIDVLCTDKTGTLTEDRPVLDRVAGPDPQVLRWAALNGFWTLHLADLPVPDPLDEAILWAVPDLEPGEGLTARPFDPVSRTSSALVRVEDGERLLIVKGAVEDVLGRCAAVPPGTREEAARLAGEGLRVLAVATARRAALAPPHEDGLAFAGFVAMSDALTPGAAGALADLIGRGVRIKVLTGDHPGAAARACRDLGLGPDAVIVADDLADLDDDALAAVAGDGVVFARCTPADKARLVRALAASGHVVGFLGDGVNDLPALRAAHVGICPRNGVDVSREAADVVVASKDLAAIERAITVGRTCTGNIITYLRIVLSSNVGNVIAMLAAGVMLPFLPMLPVQVLVQNLCFDAAQLAFAFDRPAAGTLRRPIRLRPNGLLGFIAAFGALNVAADLTTFMLLDRLIAGEDQAAFRTGWFVENLFTQALIMLMLHPGRGVSRPLWLATGALAAAGVLFPLSPLAPALGLVVLPASYYLLLCVLLLVYGVALALSVRLRDRHLLPI
ncbi:magnesium-translocating P-type ATPase [Spongiactinospora sp. TRM90649]|uniref:magnesium-translocating P-type ATPase n=1 Tax=Spongiactinospora sp. TRM90649 TaxID=3031114 RepID=UPI0023F74A5E|nr:magnesium-translocating P-type ATPase [Spongiactinospora sp. TRM90649]MDF5753603.1 magnesium-translocating P-type ATPase [Spongiactinospora sp. TRM90649]